MIEHIPFKVKLLKTIKNGGGDVFRKGSIVMAKKTYGGYTLEKLRAIKKLVENGNGKWFRTRQSISRVDERFFHIINLNRANI